MMGASAGSFINAAAARTVAEKKWWGRERSVCDKCGETLGAVDLVPIFSYIFLRGRCRHCGTRLSIRYPLTELIMGGVITAMWLKWGPSSAFVIASITAVTALFNSLTDFDDGYIYDVWAAAPGAISIVLRLCEGFSPAADGLLGALLGACVISLIIIVSRGGMGWGDAVLCAGSGGALGWRLEALAIYIGFLIGGVIMLPMLLAGKVKRRDAVPLGPFLSIGTVTVLLFGPEIYRWVEPWFGPSIGWPWS